MPNFSFLRIGEVLYQRCLDERLIEMAEERSENQGKPILRADVNMYLKANR